MLEKIPTHEDIKSYLGTAAVSAWDAITKFVDSNYNHDTVWDDGGKYGICEVKYRKSGKTLCAFYIKDGCLCILIIFGKAEREKFEISQNEFSPRIIELYNDTRQYHDGKWLWIDISDMSIIDDIKRLIMIKKKPCKAGR